MPYSDQQALGIKFLYILFILRCIELCHNNMDTVLKCCRVGHEVNYLTSECDSVIMCLAFFEFLRPSSENDFITSVPP